MATHVTRAITWRLRGRVLTFGPRPVLMGIVNVTPDSFSDGGRFFGAAAAVEHGLRLVADGADILDIGGESTRPYSERVDAAEELRRVVPVVTAVCEQTGVPVSIDTSKAAVAREAVAAGCEIINDVTALTGDPEMMGVVRHSGCGVVLMHMQGTPQTMQDQPAYGDVVQDVCDYLAARRDAAVEAGILHERICLDPGIGFGKTHTHNLTLLAKCERFHTLGCPVLIGHSRKGFIGKILGDPGADRTPGDVGVSLAMAAKGRRSFAYTKSA